ncbi:hypothetical protein J6590_018372 [Homalodisca vitripennis]|nr:hypothetical protein J6590_018372 [Homalodisca vitripennis]
MKVFVVVSVCIVVAVAVMVFLIHHFTSVPTQQESTTVEPVEEVTQFEDETTTSSNPLRMNFKTHLNRCRGTCHGKKFWDYNSCKCRLKMG